MRLHSLGIRDRHVILTLVLLLLVYEMHKMGCHLLLARPFNWKRFIFRVVSDFDLIFTRASAIRSASVTDKTLLLMLLYLSDGGAS